jgi:hypothetical protein
MINNARPMNGIKLYRGGNLTNIVLPPNLIRMRRLLERLTLELALSDQHQKNILCLHIIPLTRLT